ncbi:hypothetical protein PROFUN_16951 [Planoprotostelium fungivorum]|uniref:Uncharacterized protein n=1 Tax=Planoprotostelium fungivorum TaxID=1890364 RepID=A0A2P6MN12_9EUKA|nr:hypothetical protein PROFUN_16951 [Planoprotostelium fungivorum]
MAQDVNNSLSQCLLAAKCQTTKTTITPRTLWKKAMKAVSTPDLTRSDFLKLAKELPVTVFHEDDDAEENSRKGYIEMVLVDEMKEAIVSWEHEEILDEIKKLIKNLNQVFAQWTTIKRQVHIPVDKCEKVQPKRLIDALEKEYKLKNTKPSKREVLTPMFTTNDDLTDRYIRCVPSNRRAWSMDEEGEEREPELNPEDWMNKTKDKVGMLLLVPAMFQVTECVANYPNYFRIIKESKILAARST